MYSSPIYDDPKYRCCCNTHVERGAYIIAIIGAVLSVLGFGSALASTRWSYAGGEVLHFLLYLSVLYAQKKREPKFYLPYVILAGIGLVLMAITAVCITLAIIFKPDFYYDLYRKSIRDGGYAGDPDVLIRIFLGIELLVLIIYLIISGFFYSVIFRAWRYMRDEQDVRVPAANYTPKV